MSIVRKLFQAFVEHDAILECRVHALAVERHNRVSSVADQRDPVFVEPWRATNRDQRAGWIVSKIVEQIWHQRHSIRKFFFKEALDIVVGFSRREAARSFE